MSAGTDSGYNFDWIYVREISFVDDVSDETSAERTFPVDLEVDSRTRDDRAACRVIFRLTCNETMEDGSVRCSLRIVTEAQFSLVGEPTVAIETFAVRQAPVLMLPLVREHLATISSKTRFGQILLNPLRMRDEVVGASPELPAPHNG